MQIEPIRLQFFPYELVPQSSGANLTIKDGSGSSLSRTLSEGEYRVLQSLLQGRSIEQSVRAALEEKSPVSFRVIWTLLEKLQDLNATKGPEVSLYLNQFRHAHTDGFWSKVSDFMFSGGTATPPVDSKGNSKLAFWAELQSLPLLRTLTPEVKKLLFANAEKFEVPENFRVCRAGALNRDLFVLLRGEAGVYRLTSEQRRQLLTVIPERSIFGEGGFLLGRPREADVVTTKASTVVRIPWQEKEFSQLINSEAALALQHRFWLLHALGKSELFRSLPSESLDQFMYAGEIEHFPENMVIAREQEQGDSFFVVVQGQVQISRGGKAIKVLGQGEIFGEVAIFISGGRRTATVSAKSDALVLRVGQPHVNQVLSRHLYLACQLEQLAWDRYHKHTL